MLLSGSVIVRRKVQSGNTQKSEIGRCQWRNKGTALKVFMPQWKPTNIETIDSQIFGHALGIHGDNLDLHI